MLLFAFDANITCCRSLVSASCLRPLQSFLFQSVTAVMFMFILLHSTNQTLHKCLSHIACLLNRFFGLFFRFIVSLALPLSRSSLSLLFFLMGQERVSKSKHIQFVSGANMFIYWSTNFLWDLFVFIFPAGSITIVFAVFSIPGLLCAYFQSCIWGFALVILF